MALWDDMNKLTKDIKKIEKRIEKKKKKLEKKGRAVDISSIREPDTTSQNEDPSPFDALNQAVEKVRERKEYFEKIERAYDHEISKL